MNTVSMRGALLLAALFTGGCQTGFYDTQTPMPTPMPNPVPVATPMDGVWNSTDGVFVATFEAGRFTSRFTSTNEILAQGGYTVAGGNVTMEWISVATQQRRSAACTFMAGDTVACNQSGGGSFTLKRAGLDRPMAPAAASPAAVAPAGAG